MSRIQSFHSFLLVYLLILTGSVAGVYVLSIFYQQDNQGKTIGPLFSSSLISSVQVEEPCPNLAILEGDIVVSETLVMPGEIIEINVTVRNIGGVSTGSVTLNVSAYYDDNVLINITKFKNQVLDPGANKTVTLTWNTTHVFEGVHQLKAKVTPLPVEVNLTDNELVYGSVTVATPLWLEGRIPEINITDVMVLLPCYWVYDRGFIYPGCCCIVSVNVTLTNIGNQSETFQVTAYYDDNPMADSAELVTDLAPNETTTVTLTWKSTGAAPSAFNYTEKRYIPYQISVKVTNCEPTSDGTLIIHMPADANGDGHCSVGDLSLLGAAWNVYYPSPYFTLKADFNCDCRISVGDLAILGRYYQTY